MKPNPVHRLPAPLETAVQRLKLAAREAAERTIESLGLAALASTSAYHRDGLLGAQFELNRKSAVFVLTFNDAFDQRVLRELGPRAVEADAANEPTSPTLTDWASLSLVEDKEVEAQISAERFGMEISHACEWELRELEGFVAALLGEAGGERDRNPLRPDLVGHALIRGIDAISERADVRKVLSSELGRSLAALLRHVYADIVSGLRDAGVQPLGLAVRNRPARAAGSGDDEGVGDASQAGAFVPDQPGATRGGAAAYAESPYREGPYRGSRHGGGSHFAPSSRGGIGTAGGTRGGTPIGQIDPALMSLIRRLAHTTSSISGADSRRSGYGDFGGDGAASAPAPHNLIRAHRDELRQASSGGLDHMVIDIIGFLFDQILADPKVPPQMARQIARLQLPVLRAALGDPTFFSSRKHPVRRFINRIASLGAGFEDFADESAKAFLAKVRELVNQVVDGDFDQIETYEHKLAALEAYTAEAAAGNAQGQADAAALLAEKEDQQRLRQLYAERLAGELKDLNAPGFLREFLSDVWSQVLLRAAEQGGPEGVLAQRMRSVGRGLFLSVLPKATPTHRKAFLAELPKLMQDLTEGMNLIGWPEAQRRAFFGQLMPAHADALKSAGGRPLEINLMARQLDGALQRAPPSRADLKSAPLRPLTEQASSLAASQFSAEEARRVGLVQESAVDWAGKVGIDIDLSAEAEAPVDNGALIPGMPGSNEAPEPTEGRALADHVQLGFAYQMHLDGEWHKARLSHVSPGRSFFIFTHGAKHRRTVSLTQRMLVRLCETGRLKSFEAGFLIERATARARRQLSALAAGAQAPGA